MSRVLEFWHKPCFQRRRDDTYAAVTMSIINAASSRTVAFAVSESWAAPSGDDHNPLTWRGVSAAKRLLELIEGIGSNDKCLERKLVAALREKCNGCLKIAGMVIVDTSKRDHASHDGLRIDRDRLAGSHCSGQHHGPTYATSARAA